MLRPDLSALASRLRAPPITRFAPSPTGYLHLGHVVNAIYVWGIARALGGSVLLRIEDHDRIRSRPQFEAAILEDLDWLGFTADEGRIPPVRQSARACEYESALAAVRTRYHVYACGCSRKDIGGERYPGTCRDRRLPEAAGRGLRVQIETGNETFVDALAGPQVQHPADESGDLLIRDRDGHWTYHFAVTVDDQRDGVTLVVRGADVLAATGRQLRLARMLGRVAPPVFLHHPLLYDPAGRKLSKSDAAAGVRELRAARHDAADVIGRAAAAVGLQHTTRPVSAGAVAELFM
jgi:glutamyl-tRNA synthetase/glutamyl-Q tRNA(Asp) synthetase